MLEQCRVGIGVCEGGVGVFVSLVEWGREDQWLYV